MFAKRFFYVCAGFLCLALVATAMVCSVAAVAAQEPVAAPESVAVRPADKPSLRAGPYAERWVFFLTNSGAYVRLSDRFGGGRMQAILDWGAMVNLSPKNAVGGSWFLAGDGDGFSTGPVLRWRRWLGPTQSLDVAVGTPIAGTAVSPGSVLGLVKYNPVHWFGVAARPELVRYTDHFDPSSNKQVSGTKARLSLGAEVGGKPGFALGVVAVLALAGLAAALSGGFN